MLPSGLPERLADDEPLARFLTSDSHFNSTMPKPAAFLPGPIDSKTSVFRQNPDPRQALWETADLQIGPERRARAAAMLSASAVRQCQLDVEAYEPPPRHANIIGWPNIANDVELTRAQRKGFALRLAQVAELVRR